MAEQPETIGFIQDEAGEVSIDAWNRLKAQPLVVTDPFVVVSSKPQMVSFSTPSGPDSWAAVFEDPQIGAYHPIKGWCPPDVAVRSLPGSFQQLDADNQRAVLENPPRAKLTCDRNGMEPGSWEREQTLRAAQNEVLQAAADKIAALTERVAIMEADNAVLEARKDALIDQYAAASTAAMRLSARVLDLQAEVDALKCHQSPHPVPVESSLSEPAKPSQDAVWRNATRFSR